jgi:predicted histone-like DNA-binding protein
MARILYELRKNNNSHNKGYGKWYAHSKSDEVLDTRKLANHIAEHGSIYTADVVFGVLEKLRSCIVEMLLNSKRVKLEGLGTFYTTIENRTGEADIDKYTVTQNMKGLHIRFMPEQEQEMNISSREFLKKATFINIASLPSGKKGTSSDASGGTSGEEETGRP